nr:MAG TPA: hypothetical protein [Caudoviricetes sp.]
MVVYGIRSMKKGDMKVSFILPMLRIVAIMGNLMVYRFI